MISTVLLDVDGTLIDSNDAHADAWLEAARSEGFQLRFEDVRRLIGMGADRLLPKLTGLDADSAQARSIAERHDRLFVEAYLPRLKAFPGARDLLLNLKDRRLRLVVASSADEPVLSKILAKAGIADLIDAKPSQRDDLRSKPSPDLVNAALRAAAAGGAPIAGSQAVMIGDTPYDIEAAQRAGVRAIALLSGGWSAAELAGARAVFKDARDLALHLDLALGTIPESAPELFTSVLPL